MRTAGLLTRSGRANSATLSAIFVANFVEVRSDAIGRSIARSPIPCKLSPMQRLAKNIGGYKGETIDIQDILRNIDALAQRTNWTLRPIAVSESLTIPSYHRGSATGQKHIYISAGIHGDEPATPLAVLKLFQDNQWPEHLNIWIIPCLNPMGFVLNRRENEEGIDLNRDYRSLKTPLVREHTAWLDTRPRFTLSMSLHEDWESNGFYLYELNPDLQPSMADVVIRAVKERH